MSFMSCLSTCISLMPDIAFMTVRNLDRRIQVIAGCDCAREGLNATISLAGFIQSSSMDKRLHLLVTQLEQLLQGCQVLIRYRRLFWQHPGLLRDVQLGIQLLRDLFCTKKQLLMR